MYLKIVLLSLKIILPILKLAMMMSKMFKIQMIGVMLVQTDRPKLGLIFGTNLKLRKLNVKLARKF